MSDSGPWLARFGLPARSCQFTFITSIQPPPPLCALCSSCSVTLFLRGGQYETVILTKYSVTLDRKAALTGMEPLDANDGSQHKGSSTYCSDPESRSWLDLPRAWRVDTCVRRHRRMGWKYTYGSTNVRCTVCKNNIWSYLSVDTPETEPIRLPLYHLDVSPSPTLQVLQMLWETWQSATWLSEPSTGHEKSTCTVRRPRRLRIRNIWSSNRGPPWPRTFPQFRSAAEQGEGKTILRGVDIWRSRFTLVRGE
jgi:hypothetical protein